MKKFDISGKKSKKKMIIGGVVIVALVLIGGQFLGGSKNKDTMVTLESVENRDIEEVISLKSTVESETSYEVSSVTNQKVVEILVEEGDKVVEGQVLAILDQSSINDEIASSTKRLELSKLNLQETLKNTQIQYEDTLRSRDEAQRKLDINKALFEADAISQEDLKQYELNLQSAESALSAYTVANGVVVANDAQKKSIEVEEQSLQLLKKNLEDTYIKSSASGTVIRVNTKVGSFAASTASSKAMFEIEDLDNLMVTVKVSEYDINRVEVGMPVRITAEVLGDDVVQGEVSKILPSGENKDATSSEMIIPVEIKISNSDSRLITGVTAKAEIITKSVNSAPSIMVDSVVKDLIAGTVQVFVVQNNELVAVDVTLGAEDDFYVEILSGDLKVGDEIVNSPSYELMAGMKVVVGSEKQRGA